MTVKTIDASELSAESRRLAAAIPKSRVLVKAAVKRGAQNIKNAVQKELSGSVSHFDEIGITYNIESTKNDIHADIMPLSYGASMLDNIAFFGGARGGGTYRYYEFADQELPVLASYVALAAVEALK